MTKIIIALMLISFNAIALEQDTITGVYKLFSQEYIKKDILEDFAINTLKSLNTVDKNITIANDHKKISLYYKAKKISVINKPQNNDYKSWALTTKEIIEKATKASPILKQKSFDITQSILANAINNFDNKANKLQTNKNHKDFLKTRSQNFSSRQEEDILYITLKNISPTSYNSLKKAINNDAKKIVINLEDNDGGDVKSALNILDLFIDEGILFTTKNRDNKTKIYQAKSGDFFNNKPIDVIVNTNTASAAELIAYVLKEQGRAKIIGNKTYNKNTIQSLYIINGLKLAITTDTFYNPDGKLFNSSHQHQKNP